MHIYLETERLILRQFTPDDVDLLVELDSDPDVMHFLNGGTPTPRDVIQSQVLPLFLHYYEYSEAFGFWAAIDRSTREFLGWFCLHPEEGRAADDLALGYRLRRAAWGQGYATEGAQALVCNAFTTLGARRVFAITYEHNIVSRRVMEKAGMKLVRTFRMTPEEIAAAGTFVDSPGVVWEGDDVEYAIEWRDWERNSRGSGAGSRTS